MLLTYRGIPYASSASAVQHRYPFQVRTTGQKPIAMTYRGIPYTPSWPAIEATETAETVTFLGRQANVKEYQLEQHPRPKTEMTYRGIRYTR